MNMQADGDDQVTCGWAKLGLGTDALGGRLDWLAAALCACDWLYCAPAACMYCAYACKRERVPCRQFIGCQPALARASSAWPVPHTACWYCW
jgi:hypothetical protein